MKEWLSVSTKKDSKSKLASYVGTLPAPGSLGTPFHWSEEYLTSFPYTPLVKSVNLQRKRFVFSDAQLSIAHVFRYWQLYLTNCMNPKFTVHSPTDIQQYRWTELYTRVEKTNNFSGVSYDRFVWAMEMVRSRGFTGRKCDFRELVHQT